MFHVSIIITPQAIDHVILHLFRRVSSNQTVAQE